MKNIGYISFDASVKIHQSGNYTSTKTRKSGNGGIYGYLRHIDRSTDKKNGCEVQHSNENIDRDYTLDNESYYKNEFGDWQEAETSKDMVYAIKRRIDFARQNGARIYDGGKNDTTIVRPLLIQLDEETISDHEDTWKEDTVDILEEMFGKDNIVGVSVHKDETSVHMHVVFTPVFESTDKKGNLKCSVSQTKFFTSPKALAGMHRNIRKALQDKGYDVEQDNKPIEETLAGYTDKNGVWHQQGLTPDQLKELTNKIINLRMEAIDIKLRKDEIDRLEQAMKDVQAAAKTRQAEIEKNRTLSEQQSALKSDRETVQAQMQALVEEKVNVQQMKMDAENILERALSTADVCNLILSDESNLNQKFMEFLDREGARANKPIRNSVEHLYKKFQTERKDSLSDWQLEMLRDRDGRRKQGQIKEDTSFIPNIIDTGASSSYDFSL